MTTPIPEAAVEAAREAVHTSECGCSSRVHGPYTWDWYDEIARATLTAALPLIEAEIRGQVVLPTFPQGDDDAAIKESEARLGDAGYKPHLREWERLAFLDGRNAGWKEAREYIAATITERTQR